MIVAVPGAAISPARMEALSWVPETYVVVRESPFHLITEVDEKFTPFTVTVKAALPAGAQPGLRLVMEGSGLKGGVNARWVAG